MYFYFAFVQQTFTISTLMVHTFDMIGSLMNKKALRKTYRERYNKLKEKHQESFKPYSGKVSIYEISKEELENIKLKFRGSKIRERRESVIKTIFVTSIIILVLSWLFFKIVP